MSCNWIKFGSQWGGPASTKTTVCAIEILGTTVENFNVQVVDDFNGNILYQFNDTAPIGSNIQYVFNPPIIVTTVLNNDATVNTTSGATQIAWQFRPVNSDGSAANAGFYAGDGSDQSAPAPNEIRIIGTPFTSQCFTLIAFDNAFNQILAAPDGYSISVDNVVYNSVTPHHNQTIGNVTLANQTQVGTDTPILLAAYVDNTPPPAPDITIPVFELSASLIRLPFKVKGMKK